MMMNSINENLLPEIFVRFFNDITDYYYDMCKFFWQLEKMYWYYIDITKSKTKPSRDNMKLFIGQIKHYLIYLLPTQIDIDQEYDKWIKSRKNVPRCKVILLDPEMENVVLTKSVSNEYLIFPGGKVEETDKDLVETAIRETYEEIGIDIREIIDRDMYFDLHQNGVKNRYFLIQNINRNIYMHSNVANEIEYIKWFPIADLPNNIHKLKLTEMNVKIIRQSIEVLKQLIASLRC